MQLSRAQYISQRRRQRIKAKVTAAAMMRSARDAVWTKAGPVLCGGKRRIYVRQRDVFSDYDVIFDWHGLRRDEETITQRWLPTESGWRGLRWLSGSVQFTVVSMRSEKPICAPPRLSEVSPTLLLKRFPMFVWLTMALSGPVSLSTLPSLVL